MTARVLVVGMSVLALACSSSESPGVDVGAPGVDLGAPAFPITDLAIEQDLATAVSFCGDLDPACYEIRVGERYAWPIPDNTSPPFEVVELAGTRAGDADSLVLADGIDEGKYRFVMITDAIGPYIGRVTWSRFHWTAVEPPGASVSSRVRLGDHRDPQMVWSSWTDWAVSSPVDIEASGIDDPLTYDQIEVEIRLTRPPKSPSPSLTSFVVAFKGPTD